MPVYRVGGQRMEERTARSKYHIAGPDNKLSLVNEAVGGIMCLLVGSI